MFRKRRLDDKKILVLVRLLKASQKFLVFLALFGQIGSIVPWSSFKAQATSEINQELISTDESNLFKNQEIDPSLVPVDSEDVSMRTETEKYFRKIDGTYEVAMYADAVHYQKDGKWENIDNSLNDLGDELENKANKFSVKFPKSLDDNKQIKMSYDKYQIDWNILNINSTQVEYSNNNSESTDKRELSNINQSVLYQNIQNSVDIEYILSGSQVKENIILNEYIPNFSLTFEYKLKDLYLVNNEGAIEFVNELEEPVFSFADMFMISCNNDVSFDIDVQYIETGNKTYEITISVSDDWLQTASYPVIIDPTITSSTTTMSIDDTYISESSPGTHFSASSIMMLSATLSTDEYRGLLSFTIPSSVMDKMIIYTHLALTKLSVTAGSQLNIYKNTSFVSGASASWYNKPTYDSNVVDYYTVNSNSPFLFDITEPVKEWQSSGISVVPGFTIALDELYGATNMVYQMGTSTVDYRPLITIGYEEPSGLKDYWTYTSQDVGMVGQGYISDYTGNLTWVRNEYALDNEYMSMTLSFFHNNYTRSSNIGYGDGWRTNYNVQLILDTSISKYYMLKPDGNKVYFANESYESLYYGHVKYTSIAEDGSRMVLERNTYYGSFQSTKITTKSDLEYNFSSIGRLTTIRNIQNNNYLRVYYIDSSSQMIDYVTDEALNKIEFTWSANSLTWTQLMLKQSDGSYREVEQKTYHYDAYNNIDYIEQGFRYGTYMNTSMVYDNTLQYYFDSNNRLIYAYNESDYFQIQYSYDTKNRVSSIISTDTGLNLSNTSVTYENGKTTYLDYRGNHVYYHFDNYGHTINISDDYGNSTYYRYNGLFTAEQNIESYANGYELINLIPNYLCNNQLIESSDVMKQQQNPINNHGFEESTTGWSLYEGTDGIIDFTTDESVLGDHSLAITKEFSGVYATQSVYLKAGSYTIQGWIKHPGGAPGAYIDIIGETSQGVIQKIYGSSEWVKYTLTFTISTNRNITVKLTNDTMSTAFFDNIQIIEGFVDARYNAILNNSFESGTTSWTLNGAVGTTINETGVMEEILGEKAIYISGDGSSYKYFSQNITNLVTRGETYMIGGWGKADAVPNKGYVVSNFVQRDGRFFGLYVSIDVNPQYYGDPSTPYTMKLYLPFNSSIEDWQYQMRAIDIPVYAVSVTVYGVYQGEGTAYFDNIQLYHDKMSTSYGYEATTGNLTTINDSDGIQTELFYDEDNHLQFIQKNNQTTEISRNGTYQIEELSNNNVKLTFTYDSSTHQIIETAIGYDKDVYPQDKWFKTSTAYTTDGQYIHSTTDEFGNTTTITTDQTVGLITNIVNALGDSQLFIYDEHGNLESTQATDITAGATINSSYIYDSSGRLWKINRDGYTYEFIYNFLDQVTSVKVANITLMTYDYQEEVENDITYYTNKLNTQTYGNGDYISFTYTEENQIKTISFNGVVRSEYEYDANGNLAIYKDIYNDNIYFYSRDISGRIITTTDKDGNKINYVYDELGNISRYEYIISNISRSVLYHYDTSNGQYEYTYYNTGTTSVHEYFNYDDDSLKRLNNIELVIGTLSLTQLFVYDDAKVDSSMGNATTRIYSIIYQKNDDSLYEYQYTYDENHNITKVEVKDFDSSIPVDLYYYVYDGFNQLIRENVYVNIMRVGQFSKTYVYDYDTQGNITNIKEYNYTLGTVPVTPLNEKRMKYDNTWGDQLSKIEYYISGTLSYYESYSYDNSGNLIQITDSRTSYYNDYLNWDGRNLMSRGQYCETDSYKYDDQGIRTQKTVGTCSGTTITNYTLDGDKVLVESWGSNTIYYTYDVDGTLLSMNYNGTEYFYIKNLQGDIIELVDISGNTVVQYRYDAWGNIVYQTPNQSLGDINPYRYRGYRFDEETGFYYLNSRYYNPLIGRLINTSDAGYYNLLNSIGHNDYSFFNNDPVQLQADSKIASSSLILKTTIGTEVTNSYINSFIMAATPHTLPSRGEPNSVGKQTYPDGSPLRERIYGPDGKAVVDHDHHKGEQDAGYNHDHDWTWDGNTPNRGPARTPSISQSNATGYLITSAVIIFVLIIDDVTGIGVADDVLIPAMVIVFAAAWSALIYGDDALYDENFN